MNGILALPLDDDGFLRRECPSCELEFKWLPSEGSNSEDSAAADREAPDYFCPYCAVQSGAGSWFTKPQLEAAQAIALQEVIPELEDMGRGIERSTRGGMIDITMRVESNFPKPKPLPAEPNDMRRVDFTCHPDEPVKVLETWDRSVKCLVCGTEALA